MECQIQTNEDVFKTKSSNSTTTTTTNNKTTSNCVSRLFNRRRDSSPAKMAKTKKSTKNSDSLSNFWNGTPAMEQRQHMVWSANNGRTDQINNNSGNSQNSSGQVGTLL